MSRYPDFHINDKWILSKRGKKNQVDPLKPYGYFIENERTVSGSIENVTTILLTNNECPFHCLMCDLWKNTTNKPVLENSIPKQIEFALSELPETKHLKLYNSGSFFDDKAILSKDYKKIASLISHFETVIVESHTAFIDNSSLQFQDLIKPKLHIAIGLETVHPEILPKLNKKMRLEDFDHSVRFLNKHGILTRAFILLRPPFLSESEGVYWAKKSIDHAFKSGVASITIIPVRSGNGALDFLRSKNYFEQPTIESLEEVQKYGIGLKSGSVFADLWDIENFSTNNSNIKEYKERLNKMNLSQELPIY